MSDREIDHMTPDNAEQTALDIEKFATNIMGITLMPHQVELIKMIAAGKTPIFYGRRAGAATARKVLEAYIVQGSYIKHFENVHFTGMTYVDQKFVYCPVGNIVSWSAGDHDNKWCHFCGKYFDEIGKPFIAGMPIKTDAKLAPNEIRFDHPDGRSEGFKI